MKNLLITGSSGFIGSYCADNFEKHNYNIYCISSKNNKAFNKKNFLKKTFEVSKIRNFIKKNKINYVLLSHGSTNHVRDFNKIYKDHFLFTKLIIENLDLKYLKKIIFLSTGDEYGHVKKLPIKEDFCCRPNSNYSLVKNITTNFLINYFHKKKVSVIVLRLFLIFGKNQRLPRLIPLLKDTLKKNRTFHINSLTQKKDLCHISDLYKVLSIIFLHKTTIKDIFNFGSGYQISIKQVINIVEKKYNKKIKVKFDNKNAIKNSFSFYPDITKLKKIFKISSFKRLSSDLF